MSKLSPVGIFLPQSERDYLENLLEEGQVQNAQEIILKKLDEAFEDFPRQPVITKRNITHVCWDVETPSVHIAYSVEKLYYYEPSTLLGYRLLLDEAEALRHYQLEEDNFIRERYESDGEDIPYWWDGLREDVIISPVEVPV